MQKTLLMQIIMGNGIIPSKNTKRLCSQILNEVQKQLSESYSSTGATSEQVTSNTNKLNTISTRVDTLFTNLEAATVQVSAHTESIDAHTEQITANKTAIEQAAVVVDKNTNSITNLETKVDQLSNEATDYATKDELQSIRSDINTTNTEISNLFTGVDTYKTTTDSVLSTHSQDITDIKNSLSSLESLKADMELVNKNTQKINEHAEQYESLVNVVNGIQDIKADVETVQAAKADIQTNLNNISANTTAISNLSTEVNTIKNDVSTLQSSLNTTDRSLTDVENNLNQYKTTTDTAIEELQTTATNTSHDVSTIQETLTSVQSTLTGHDTDITKLKQDTIAIRNTVDSNTTAISTKANKSDLESVRIIANTVQTTTANHNTAISNNTSAIATLQQEMSTKLDVDTFNTEIDNYASKSELPDFTTYVKKTSVRGLVSIDGENVTTSEHAIKTIKDGKTNTAKIWNEPDGGGVMFDSRSNQTKSFAGCNDGTDDIDVQLYAKKYYDNTATSGHNVGTRIALNTSGAFYTKNKNNGTFTVQDEIATIKDIPSIEGLATEQYVNDKISAIAIPSITGLASIEYVDQKVSSISVPSLSGYATEAYVNEKVNGLQIPSIEGLASETYVNDAISNITLPDTSSFITNSNLTGLVAINGVNVSSAEHKIVTQKNGKNITAKLWNETSGGGAQMRNENVGKVSFVGVNNGDGDNEIWVQQYAKDISTNSGARTTLSTTGFFYTKNKTNGAYTTDDEVVTKKMLTGLLAVDGTNAPSAEHKIVTTKNNKTITARLWNETSGGGAQMTNLDVDKISFVGVNNGDGDNEIWVQQYAKIKSTNIGARTTLSTTGFFYTKNQNNGSYTADDEVLTKRDEAAINEAIQNAILEFKTQLVTAGIATKEQLGLQ